MKLGSSRGMDTKPPPGSERSKRRHELRLTRRSQPPYPWPPEQAQPGVSKPCRTTPDVYANNLEILKIDVSQVDALIISHGHFDHVGGLMGFLEGYRARMRKALPLYTGGEDDFCSRFNR